MSKIELLVLKEDLSMAVGILHCLGLLHIEQMPLTQIMEKRGISRLSLDPEEEKEKAAAETLLKEINELLPLIPLSVLSSWPRPMVGLEKKSIYELTDLVSKEIKPPLTSLVKEIAGLKDKLNILPQYREILKSFALSRRELKIHEDMSCLALIFDRGYEKDIDFFQKTLEEKIKIKLEIYTAYLNSRKMVALVFYPLEMARPIDEEVFKKGTIKIELPNKYLNQPLAETIKSLETLLNQIPLEIQKLERTFSALAGEKLPLIYAIKALTLNRLEELLTINNFLQSRYTAAITGWLPAKRLDFLKQELARSLAGNFVIYDSTHLVKNLDERPVLLENPKVVRPYELLLTLLPLPKYGTKDPTAWVSLFFPLFFGLIVGDIGYGLIFLFISLFLKRSPGSIIRSISSITFAVSLSTILFGVLFGEFFGNLGRDYLKLPHLLFNRHESIIPFLLLALSLGAFHIVLGFFLGIIEACHKRHKKEAIEKIGMVMTLAGLFLLIACVVKILPSAMLPPSIVLLSIAMVLLIILRGFLGPLEAISAIANILSYARLMALGVAGVMMAGIANHIGGLPEDIFLGIILASLLHALNLALSVFSPTIQSLRLHYVEFFSKFYEPGGKRYNPFRRKEVAECIR